MDNSRLTNFDKYLLAARKKISEEPEVIETNVKSSSGNEYEQYLRSIINGEVSCGSHVMKQEEFYGNVEKNTVKKERTLLSYESYEPVAKPKKTSALQFKKNGKILLIIYVILMLALASILIVTNTTGLPSDNHFTASAESDKLASSAETGSIRSMTISEESSSENGWFDRLCDSLNK